MSAAPLFDLANMQGNILLPYTHPRFRALFVRIDDRGRGREALGQLMEEVTTAEAWSAKPATTLNLLLSAHGLRALGLPREVLDTFAGEFREGMASRAAVLGDVGPAAPDQWDGGLGSADIHLAIVVYALDGETLDARLREVEQALGTLGGLTIVSWQDGARLATPREHFGYADGIGQPAIEGNTLPELLGHGVPRGDGSWRAVKAGEFLLGYADEEEVVTPPPLSPELGKDGAYVVYRRLQQHVGRFRDLLRQEGARYPGGGEQLAAKLVGRWRDGTPVSLAPDRPDPALGRDPERNNAFRYDDDARGMRCPVGAHIRRANPRDAFGFGEKIVNRHRILRRGLPYGAPLPEDAVEDDGVERGVLFFGYNASISRQFEFIQAQWFNDGNLFSLGNDKDPLLGNHAATDKYTINGSPPYFVHPVPRLVTMRGGEYFFLPSIAALRYFATALPPA